MRTKPTTDTKFTRLWKEGCYPFFTTMSVQQKGGGLSIKKARRLFYFLILLGVVSLVFLQNPRIEAVPFEPPRPAYLHQIWQSEDGLPHPVVRAIIQSRQGYLWLGTEDGLVRFDGVRFREMEKKTFTGKTERWFIALAESSDGSIWTSSAKGGVLRFKDGKTTHYTTEHGLVDKYVLTVYEDSKGDVWVGTAGGLNRFKDGRFQSYTNQPGLIVEATRAILEDRQKNLWIGTAKGLSCLTKEGRFVSYTTDDLLKNNAILCLFEDRKGGLWIGTSGGGMTHVNADGELAHYSVKDGLAHNVVRAIYEDSRGNIWIGSQGGLQFFERGKFYPVPIRNPVDLDFEGISFVYSICEDREGDIWVGTNLGLNRLRRQDFSIYAKEEGLPNNLTTCVMEDKSGNIWIGTYGGGLCRIRGDDISVLTSEHGLADDNVLSLCETRDGALWIGTDGAGLNRLKDGVFSNYIVQDVPQANVIRAIYQTSRTNLWIGNNLGIGRFKDGQIAMRDDLLHDTVKCIVEDPKGTLWLAGGVGILQMMTNTTKTYRPADGFQADQANTIYPDAQGNYWIGTDKGLFCYWNGEQFFNLTGISTLANQRIFHIVEDDSAHLWMSTRNGVFGVKKKDLIDYARGNLPGIGLISFGKKEGMRRAQCNGIGQPSGWKSRDGRIWFPTMHGIMVFDPRKIEKNQLAPPVVIEEIDVDDKVIPAVAHCRISPSRGQLEFHFSALSFQAPEKVRFKYMLEGVDEQWEEAGARRIARYTNLKPREYRFHVKACNNDGVWNETGATLEFWLTPHFYQTWWFYALCVAGAVVGGASLVIDRYKQRRQLEQELRKQVEKHTGKFQEAIKTMESFNYSIAHDLRAPLRAIKGFTGALMEDYSTAFDNTAREYSKRIQLAVDRMDALITDLLTFGGITHKEVTFSWVDINTVLARIASELGNEILERKAKVEAKKPLPSVWANETLLHQILSNLISNGLKFVPPHTPPSLRIWAEQTGVSVKIFVKDNGIGIDPEHHNKIFGVFQRLHTTDAYPGTGIGLAIVQKAIERMDGKVGLTSRLGEGTCFWVELFNPPTNTDPKPEKAKETSPLPSGPPVSKPPTPALK